MEKDQEEQMQVIRVEIEYRPRDGWGKFEVDPPQFRSRRDLIRGALSVVEDVLAYEATTEIATAAMAKAQEQAEVEALRQKIAGG